MLIVSRTYAPCTPERYFDGSVAPRRKLGGTLMLVKRDKRDKHELRVTLNALLDSTSFT